MLTTKLTGGIKAWLEENILELQPCPPHAFHTLIRHQNRLGRVPTIQRAIFQGMAMITTAVPQMKLYQRPWYNWTDVDDQHYCETLDGVFQSLGTK
jgi:hypothetical protein